jgi:hypothetical protein
MVGAAAMAIAAFLPLDEPNSVFRAVEHNTLIQNGGVLLVAFAVGIAASGFQASQRRGNWLALPIVLCILAGLAIVRWASNKDLRTLYPVGLDGSVDTSKPGTVAPLGIALYVAGAGVAVALIGSVMLRQTKGNPAAPDPLVAAWEAAKTTKKCPDCAETILADAKVCKHCGYRFTPTSAPNAPPKTPSDKSDSTPNLPPTTPSGNSTKVKCHHCQHVQMVPVSQQSFVCDECGTKLQRRKQPAKGS